LDNKKSLCPVTFFIKKNKNELPKELIDSKMKMVLDAIHKEILTLKSGETLNILVETNDETCKEKQYTIVKDNRLAKLRSAEIADDLNNLYFMDNINTISLNII
jgi:hypothetical protein